MLKISGTSALSDFRVKKLLAELQAVDSNIKAVSARFIHFVDVESSLNDSQAEILSRLLSYGSGQSTADALGERLLVVPRSARFHPGQQGDRNAQRCGLSEVKRIERGIEYTLDVKAAVSCREGAAR
jgi:phosphoribosylformylglycinamidine synthase